MLLSANTTAMEVTVLDGSKYYMSLTRSMLNTIGVRRALLYDQPIEALRDLLAQPSDVVVVDSELPQNISCLRLIRGMRDPARAPLCFIPIIVTTYRPTKSFVEAAIRNGANTVLAKPYSPLALKQRLIRAVADRDKLVLKDGRYVMAEILDSMEARALAANPTMLAALLHGAGGPNSQTDALQSMINMLWSNEEGAEDESAWRV
jgi:CheY-like chemotaxis protein